MIRDPHEHSSLPWSGYAAKLSQRASRLLAPWAAVLATAVLASAPLHAATYYVSPSGSDTNAGTSTGLPWKTCAKVNATHFNAGDSILFQRGGEWHESVNPTGGDGAAGNPITFADYGSGAKPKFWGSDPVANSGWTNTTGTIYTHSYTTQVGAVYVNHVALVPANPNANQPVESIPGSFSWDGNTLKINVPSNPNSDGKLYTVASRQDVICNGNAQTYSLHNHLVFTNLVCDETGDLNGGYGVRIMNGTDIVLNGVESYRCGKHNFGCINATQVIHNNCYAAYPMPNQDAYGGYTAYVSYGDNSTGMSGQTSEYHYCVGDYMDNTYHTSSYVDTGYEFFTTHGSNVGSIWLDHCSALSTAAGGPGAHWTISNTDSAQAGHAAAITITGGFLQNNQLYMQGTGLVVDGLHMQGPGGTSSNDATSTIDMECSNSTVQNMLMDKTNVGYWLYQAAVQNNGANNVIRFNTFVNDPNSGNAILKNDGASLNFYGNILVDSGNWLSDNAPASSSYNLIATTASTVGFNNASAGDYSLLSTSAAVNAVPTSVSHPSTDINGSARPQGSAVDEGAYEYGGSGPVTPVITSGATASGTVGSAFSYQIVASNAPTSYSATGLPAGVTINSGTGLISGTPTTAGTSTVTLGATNGAGTGNKTLTITISAAAPSAPVITSASTASGMVGTAFSYQITASNSPTSYSASGLPSGLSVNTSTGLISGTPTATGTSTVTLGATNAGGTGNLTLTITISASTGTAYNVNAIYTSGTAFSTGGLDTYNHAYLASELGSSATYNGSSFTFAAPNVLDAWSNITVALPAGSYTTLNMVGCSSGGIATNQTFTVNYTDSTTQAFTLQMSDWTNGSGYSDETNVTTMAHCINSDGTLTTQSHYLKGYTFTLNGKSVASITLPGNRGVVVLAFAASGAVASPPVISSAATASGTVGAAFSYQIVASNSPTSYSASGLPAGLSVNTSTGAISGTPTASGTSTVTLGATNAGGTGNKTLTITIAAAPPAVPVISSGATASGTVGTAFSYQITASNSPTSYSASGLPAGLSVNTSTGLISGTPTASGTSTVTLGATNAGGTGNKTLTITISAASGASLTGTLGTPASSVNLTTEGTLDWAHWGSDGSGSWTHKSGANLIANWTATATVFTYPGNAISYIWSDGTNWNGTAQATGFYFSNASGYFSFTAPADTTTHTLRVYVGTNAANGTLSAHLSDSSAPDYTNSSLAQNSNGVYTLTYRAASAGQTLTVKWTNTSALGSITVQSASLQ
ncbi:hypothetical protein CCAX7_41380 [Capsulimonas corticalis]|uniref:Right handed beta helix domain-containing protein n=1 Tax=Capsulimonas corticalis TaxID=2219043 RepID=A0A9N7L6W2_9BACT|nr:Ig domain-containing protein [Capsulimonas corticalis]BDI32087.1 hypothetical protein CCAX7_41380 [Capsulimonas corticalis]